MQLKTQKRYYTLEEYLKLEEKAEFRSEYCDGKIVSMTGGTTNHNKIALNLAASLKIALKGKNMMFIWVMSGCGYPDIGSIPIQM